MYVDESGDTGMTKSPTRYFLLTGMIIHELRWRKLLDDMIGFRKELKVSKNLRLSDEIHSVNFLNSPGELVRIKRNDRIDILKQCIKWTNSHLDISIITIAVDKNGKSIDTNIFEIAWEALIQRFENTIRNGNFNDLRTWMKEE